MEGCDDDETGKVFLALVKFSGLAIMLNLVTSKKTYLADVTNRRIRAVVPKVCSADHKWSAIIAQVVRQSLYKSVFCASRSTKIF